MPDFLVSAATGALGPVLNKLAGLLSDEYKRFKGVRGEIRFLVRELEAMHAFLLKKSEEENPDAQDKVWMKEVRELSYDIEDSLDDFRVRVDDDLAKPDRFIDKCKNLLDKTKARRRIAKAIQDLKLQVKEVSERNARYKEISDTVMNTSKVTVDPRALAIFEDASRLVGIDQPKQEIISFLKKGDGDISSQQPKIVSIVGIGGIGKTTLANRVYEELKDQFEYQIFFSVSRNSDILGILRTILIKVKREHCYLTDIQQLIMEIKDFLQTKRYLIVVDDVWDVKTWETMKCALTNNSCSSVIITTTRIHDVAKACCSLYPDGWVYQPKPLEEHDSKMLFQNRIFGAGNECPKYLKEVSDKILKKCGGLPLAIITISGLLANKARNGVHSVTQWDQVQTSIGRGLERDSTVEGMMGILSLSYFDLPSHLKACLLYLNTFPEDYEIEKDRLVLLWVVEGFIPAESTCTLYESGEKSFTELINRNLILPNGISWTGEVYSCHVHDTILDFIMCKSTEDNFVAVHGIPRLTPPQGIKVRRLSLQGETDGDVIIHLKQNYANVRSIISFGFPCSLLGVRFLRILDFTCCLRMENHHLANIGELLQLRYLGLRKTPITELPEQIGALQYLETLDLRGCFIIQLPAAIVQLKRLVNLLCPWMLFNCFPSGIKNMQALEWLDSVEIDMKAAAILVEEIGDLIKMRHLDIAIDGNNDEESYVHLIKKMVSSFQRLNKLQTLEVEYRKIGHDIFDGDDIILEVPWCSASLRRLVFKMNPMPRVPRWMKSLVNIEELKMRMKKLDQESLCILGDLPVLVDLALEIVNNVEDVPSTDKQQLLISNRHGYRSLRHFWVHALDRPSIPMLVFEAGSMPKLNSLRIDFDADITISVRTGRLNFGLKHLSQLTKGCCTIWGTTLNFWRVQNAIQKEHPCFESAHRASTEGESSSRVRLRPRRRSQSTVHTTQAKASSVADLSEQQVVQQPADNAIVCTSGGDVKTSSTTIHHDGTSLDNTCPSMTAALALPTDLSFTIHHDGTSLDIGRRHRQQWRQQKARQGTTIHGRQLVQCAPITPHGIKGASGSAPENSSVPPCFTFSSGSPRNAEVEQVAKDCDALSQHYDDLANAFTNAFNGLTLDNYHPGYTVKAASSDTAPSDVLGRRLIAAPQQQEAIVPPCFIFSSESLPNAEAEQQAMVCYKPSQRDYLANALSSAFDALSLRNNHPCSSATAIEAASLNTGAAAATSDVLGTFSCESPPNAEAEQQAIDRYEPSQHDDLANHFSSIFNAPSLHDDHAGPRATYVEAASWDTEPASNSDVLRPPLTAAPQQQEAIVPVTPCFTFCSGSSPHAEAVVNAFSSAFNGLSLRFDHPGSSATAVDAAFSNIVEGDDEEGALEWNTAIQVCLPNPNDWEDVSDFNHLFWGPNDEGGERHEADQPELPDLNLNISGGDEAEDLPDFNVSGAAPATFDVLGPHLVVAPQQQETLLPPCFTFSFGSPPTPNSEAEQHTMDCYKPSQHHDLQNAFSNTFDGLTLHDDHPGSSATAVEAASLNTGSSSCKGGGHQEPQ